MPSGGWLKLYRGLLQKPLWTETTAEQKVLLLCLLMRANYQENTWIHRSVVYTLQPGQLITSVESLVKQCGQGMTDSKVRTALGLFEKMGFLTQKSTKRNTLITIVNWASYQADPADMANRPPNRGQTDRKQITNSLTTNKKLRSKEVEEVKEIHGGRAAAARKNKFKTGFHLEESRLNDYSNDELERILLEKRRVHRQRQQTKREAEGEAHDTGT